MTISANYPTVRPSIDLDFANSQALDPRISYSRATTGTYYNGVSVATAEQNFLLYSQTFQNAAWTAVGLTPLDNQTLSPDGINSTAASLTTGSTASNTHSIVATASLAGSINNGQTTISFYAKANTANFITISSYGGNSNWYCASTFNLSTGVVTQNVTGSGSPIVFSNSNILSVGNGWYRCSVTTTNVANNYNPNRAYIQINDTGTPTLGTSGLETWSDSTSAASVYVWGAQYENRSFAGTYQVTTSSLINNATPQLLTAPINQPRFDFNPSTGASLGLLLEGVSTNLLKYSADLTQWTQSNSSISIGYPNNNVSPDGSFTGQFIQENGSTSTHYVSQTITKAASALQYTFSVYAKAGTRTYNWLQVSDGAGNGSIVYFNLSTGQISTAVANTGTWGTLPPTPASITLVGNGWYRCCLTVLTNSATTLISQHGLSTDGSTSSYGGNSNYGIYAWGAQLEQTLGYQTSYVPTLASQVTRAADVTSIQANIFSTVFNIQQGTIYSKITAIYGNGNIGPEYYDIYGNNGVGSGDSIRAAWVTAWGGIAFALNSGNPYLGSGITTPTTGTLNTIQSALSYAQTGYIASSNGFTAATSSTNGSRTGNGTEVLILNGNSGATPSVWFSKFAIYPQASSATQVQALTGS